MDMSIALTATSQYTLLRVALEMFEKSPAELSEQDYQAVLHQANRQLAIGKRVLTSAEAKGVVVPDAVVNQAMASLAGRYASAEAFAEDLERNGLDSHTLFAALRHELTVEAVLDRVMARQDALSEHDLEIYYYQHLDKFTLPETRTVRHILITINDEYAENRREQVEQRMAALYAQLHDNPERFEELAKANSECPTAMQDGLLGRVKPGQLYAELDQELFSMDEGEVSEVIESPVGLHILWCEQVHPGGAVPFAQVRDKLRERLENNRRKAFLREWLKQSA